MPCKVFRVEPPAFTIRKLLLHGFAGPIDQFVAWGEKVSKFRMEMILLAQISANSCRPKIFGSPSDRPPAGTPCNAVVTAGVQGNKLGLSGAKQPNTQKVVSSRRGGWSRQFTCRLCSTGTDQQSPKSPTVGRLHQTCGPLLAPFDYIDTQNTKESLSALLIGLLRNLVWACLGLVASCWH